ncbi:phospholipase D-like domain-containing protein [Pseudomonas sp. B21-017]|jgi:phosphatidylserine/phosphatidylglycerophosphate/cardiolipin synthase-like enzyme|uniref:phospholipase D-like domain-containing protein n=1 Tax=Pseudomonas TaxID=286 RepID=UPI00036C98CF|nr:MULTISPECIES: phospholipase D-like domain-containing protein [Pseudomonas]ANI59799.1 phospholipase [Pseudomonas sp. GR 6-02]MBD9606590.1 phospholipase [Pseudomonas sp. PDM08]MDR7109513.1 phosphatidylserine/phosphatidylglycerophosphate/cardiolipin synthase-like enzyme [Pseudomonas frederiksbergensis]UVM40947.1 phospholipase D-like domain-containing protein [Pseudomonas sp. B21-017]
MRVLARNDQDDFRVKAYAGTNGVLLAIDLAEPRRKGLLGFAIEKQQGDKPWLFLFNSLTFPGKDHTFPQFHATPSDAAPLQKFRWADYAVNPGVTIHYRVHLAYGTADAPQLGESLEVTVTTDDGLPKGQNVIFNRAVAASQAFQRKFADLDALLSVNKTLPIEEWPDAPRQWLENGLLARLLGFIERAVDGQWALDIAIYEYQLQAIVDAVNAAFERGVKVRVLYHAQPGEDTTALNEASLEKIPAANKRGRVTHNIFHDKFMVLSRLDAAGQHQPEAVLCGSTNFTANGVYRQANVVHVLDDARIGATYLQTFEQVWATPTDVGATRDWLTEHNPMQPDQPLFAGFSPRSGEGDLSEFIKIINAAKKDLLFVTAFTLPDKILNALLGQPHDDILRYGLQNTVSNITGFHADRTAEFAATALLNTGLEGWLKENMKGQKGNLLVHTKAIVVDFTSDSPTIISGSHNLSDAASNGNDENYLIIRGDTDLADRYGLELLRFYEHYRFRYFAKKLQLKQVRPLAADDSWTDDYYREGDLRMLSRLRFSGR